MRVRFIAEYDGGVRTPITVDDVADSAEAYRRAADLLRWRPLAHRIEVWDGGVYVTRATRGVVVRTQADLFADAQDDPHDPRSER